MKYDEICDDSLDNLTAVIRDIFNLTETSIAYSYDHLLTSQHFSLVIRIFPTPNSSVKPACVCVRRVILLVNKRIFDLFTETESLMQFKRRYMAIDSRVTSDPLLHSDATSESPGSHRRLAISRIRLRPIGDP